MNRVLLIHRGSLGDFLLLLPALHLLREHLPRARIHALGRPEILKLAQPHILDSVDSADRSLYLPLFENPDAPLEHLEHFASFSSFDAALAFVNDPARSLEQNLLRLGIKKTHVGPPFPPQDRRVHVAQYFHEVVVSFLEQGPQDSREVSVPIFSHDAFHLSVEEKKQAEQVLHQMGSPSAGRGDSPPIAIHPGSGSERKCWPLERYLELAGRIHEKGERVLFVLGPADERLRQQLASMTKNGREGDCSRATGTDSIYGNSGFFEFRRMVSVPGAREGNQSSDTLAVPKTGISIIDSLPLRELAAVLSSCAAYVGNDSGVTHLAALAGLPTVAIFGPTDPTVWGPVGPKVHVIRKPTECAPCARSEMYECERRACLDDISIDAVETALDRRQRE